ncbi:MAG: Maf family protein, partial [Clostridia bacterium]|nr:Maf family protein [Clostridia bacterium]
SSLSGNTHTVYTGFALTTEKGTVKDYAESKVTFPVLKKETIKAYVESGKPMDKAGSYGLQDGFIKIESFTGSKENIIGLPIEKIKPLLDALL